LIRHPQKGVGEGFILQTTSDSDELNNTNQIVRLELFKHSLESLILAQDERWRRA
jgi:hypothetical protein